MIVNVKRLFSRGIRAFRERFNENPDYVFAAPGRVEVIGNHIDYQGGSVISLALEKYVLCLLKLNNSNDKRQGRSVKVFLADFKRTITFNITEIQNYYIPKGSNSEDRYIKGLLAQLITPYKDLKSSQQMEPDDQWMMKIISKDSKCKEKLALLKNGFAAVVTGDVPIGEGVSSSAAFLVSLLECILESIHLKLSFFEKVQLIRMSEHRFGNLAGHQDQTVSMSGGTMLVVPQGQKPIPIKMHSRFHKFIFLLLRSGISRSLSSKNSHFATRVEECNEALEIINNYLYKNNLKQISHIASLINFYYSDNIIKSIYNILPLNLNKRVRHILEETERVNKAYKALINGKVEEFAQLLNDSGESSANLYEVSHPKVEDLKKLIYSFFSIEKTKYAFGARMMGGGNGGMVLVFAPRDKKLIQRLQSYLRRNYYNQKIRYNFAPIEVSLSPGLINLSKYINSYRPRTHQNS